MYDIDYKQVKALVYANRSKGWKVALQIAATHYNKPIEVIANIAFNLTRPARKKAYTAKPSSRHQFNGFLRFN